MKRTAVVLVALAILALAMPVTEARASPRTEVPVVDLGATPKGWVPVDFGDAQISVPTNWFVLYPNAYSCQFSPSTPGTVFLGSSSLSRSCLTSAAPSPQATVVHLVPQRFPSEYLQQSDVVVLNGLHLYGVELGGVSGYYSPLLGFELVASGPMAQKVLGTFTASPRAVALSTAPMRNVSFSQRLETFAGLQFSVPRSWPVVRTRRTPGLGNVCGTSGVAFWDTDVTLSTDTLPMIVPMCPVMLPYPQPPHDAVQVDAGLRTGPEVTSSFHGCVAIRRLSVCPATTPAYSILVLKVTVPARSDPLYVSIGLAGNGMIARTILHSLRAVS